MALSTNSWQAGHMAKCMAGQSEIWETTFSPPLGTGDYFATSEKRR